MNSTATTLVTDFMKPLKMGDNSDDYYLKWARRLTVVMGFLGTAFGLFFLDPDIESLFDEFIRIVGLILGMLGGIFLLGVLSKRAHATGAFIGCLGGTVVVLYVWRMTEITSYFYPFASVGSCLLIGWIASFLPVREKQNTDGLTIYSLRDN